MTHAGLDRDVWAKLNVYIEPAFTEETRWVGQCVRCKCIHMRSTFQSGLADGYGVVGNPDDPVPGRYDAWRVAALKAPGRPRLLRSCQQPDRKTRGTEDCGGLIYECEGQAALLAAYRIGGLDALVAMVRGDG